MRLPLRLISAQIGRHRLQTGGPEWAESESELMRCQREKMHIDETCTDKQT